MRAKRQYHSAIAKLRNPGCQLCGLYKSCKTVCLLGAGPEPCDIMVIGEAPGRQEDEQGIPFVGKSGEFLEGVLSHYGIPRGKVFIANAVNCRPPENRTPKKGEINKCRGWLEAQLEIVKPKYILLLGNVPLQAALGSTGIKKYRGKPIERDGIIYMPTYHPSYVFRDPRVQSQFESDIEAFATITKRGSIPKAEGLSHKVVSTWKQFKRMLKDLRGTVSFDIETTCLYPWAPEARVTSVGFGTKNHQWTIPFKHWDSPWDDEDLHQITERLTDKLLEDCHIVAHNGKFDSLWMRVHYGVEWPIDFDTMLAHFLLDENSLHGLKHLSKVYYGAPDYDIPPDEKKGDTPYSKLSWYHACDLFYTRKLRFTLGRQLYREGDVKRVFEEIMMPCVNIFTDIEYNGVYIDVKKMDEVETYLRKLLSEAEEELSGYTKQEGVNWGSTKQLGVILFEELGIEPHYTPKGNYATNESVLNQIDHPIRSALLKYRGAKQQLSFFIDGWKPFLIDGYIHPSFKLHGTVTGRLSCEHPNLQQVPRDKTIRSLITAPKGWTLVECDLSQIELRIAAELSGDQSMMQAFTSGIDVHWLTAIREIARSGALPDLVTKTACKYTGHKKLTYSESIEVLLKMGPNKAVELFGEWKEYRKKAKAINFGYLYGMWWKKFKQYALDNYGVRIDDDQAQSSRVAYFDLYQQLPDWHDRQKRYARRNGYVVTLSGRKRRLPDAMMNQDCMERRGAERQAINSPVQSFANELNLMALIQLYEEFPRHILKIVGTVHDSVLFRVRNKHVEKVTKRMLEIMTHPDLLDEFDIKIRVPIEAEESLGAWGTGVSLEKWKRSA